MNDTLKPAPGGLHGLQKVCRLHGRMKCGDTMMVWDCASEEAVPASEMPIRSKRWRPVEFHVKGSEWKKMPAKTKAALVEMVKRATKMVLGPTCPRCASWRVQQIGVKRWHCCSCQKRWSVRTPNG